MRPFLCLLLGLATTTHAAPPEDDYILAAYGCFIWNETEPNIFAKPWANDLDLRKDFPERKPLSGWYDDTQLRFDKHLELMDKSGLDVLIVDWYPEHVDEEDNAWLNNGTHFFMASKVKTDLRFCLSLINHDPFAMTTKAHWDVAVEQWLEAFRHPRYWKVDGKPVLTVHSTWHMERDGDGVDGVARRVAWLRSKAVAAGFPGLLLGGGSDKCGERAWWDPNLRKEGWDFMSYYNRTGWQALEAELSGEKDTALPYAKLIEEHTALWDCYKAQTDVPLVPCMTVQWDPRPWWGSGKAHSLRYLEPTDAELEEFAKKGRALLDEGTQYRIPTEDGAGVKAFFLCAWNEMSEGSYLVPTQGEGDRRMAAIRKAFGRD